MRLRPAAKHGMPRSVNRSRCLPGIIVAAALAAKDNGVPFWVACPSSTIDWAVSDGLTEIEIEERDASEVTTITGRGLDGKVTTVRVAPSGSPAANPAFDVTPARLVTGIITERGRCTADAAGLAGLFPERA